MNLIRKYKAFLQVDEKLVGESEAVRLYGLNLICGAMGVVSLVYTPLYLYFEFYLLASIVASLVFVYGFFIPFQMKKNRFYFAKFFTMCFGSLLLLIISYLLHTDTGFNIFYLLYAAFPFLYFRLDEWKTILFLEVLACSMFAGSYWISAHYDAYYTISPEIIKFLYFAFQGTVYVFIGVITYFISLSNNHYLELLKRSTQELGSKRAQLIHTEKLASIGELAAGVGHEINNPLTIAIGNHRKIGRELVKDGFYNSTVEKALKVQIESMERISVIVNGLRTYARKDNDKIERMDVGDIIENTISLVRSMFEKTGITLHHQIEEKGCFIDGNTGRFQQILMNLIQNSRDSLEDSAYKHIVIQEFMNTQNEVVLTVSDTGCGMTNETRSKMFDAFFTTKELGSGTGMGMGIINSLVREMKGTIEIETQINKGTSVILTFPSSIEVESSLENVGSLSNSQETTTSENLSGRILIVDDEEGIREVLKDSLEYLGLDVDEARDGDEGLEMLKNNSYDLVCTDMTMPKLSGDKFIELARKLPNGDIPYILITGGMTSKTRSKNIELDEVADKILIKPFGHDTFCELIKDQLRKNVIWPSNKSAMPSAEIQPQV